MRRLFQTNLRFTAWAVLAIRVAAAQGTYIGVFPEEMDFTIPADSFPTSQYPGSQQAFIANPAGVDHVPFKLAAILPGKGGVNFVTVSPSSGVAPMYVTIALNLSVVPYLNIGTYTLSVSFLPEGGGSGGAVLVVFRVVPAPPPKIGAIVSAATFQPTISPGEVVSIFGANIGTPPISGQADSSGFYPTSASSR